MKNFICFLILAIASSANIAHADFDSTTENAINSWMNHPRILDQPTKQLYAEYIKRNRNRFPFADGSCELQYTALSLYLDLFTPNQLEGKAIDEKQAHLNAQAADKKRIKNLCSDDRFKKLCPSDADIDSPNDPHDPDYKAKTDAFLLTHLSADSECGPTCRTEFVDFAKKEKNTEDSPTLTGGAPQRFDRDSFREQVIIPLASFRQEKDRAARCDAAKVFAVTENAATSAISSGDFLNYLERNFHPASGASTRATAPKKLAPSGVAR